MIEDCNSLSGSLYFEKDSRLHSQFEQQPPPTDSDTTAAIWKHAATCVLKDRYKPGAKSKFVTNCILSNLPTIILKTEENGSVDKLWELFCPRYLSDGAAETGEVCVPNIYQARAKRGRLQGRLSHFAQRSYPRLDGSVCCAIQYDRVFAKKKITFWSSSLDLAGHFKIFMKNGQINTTKNQKIFKLP